jgi:hypothetical protein
MVFGFRGPKARDDEEPAAAERRGLEADSAATLAVPRCIAVLDAAGLLATPIPLSFPGTGSRLRAREADDDFDIRFMLTCRSLPQGRSFEDEKRA